MLLAQDAFRRLCRARELLGQIEEQRLSIRDLACQAGMSPFHFIRQFDKLFGLTPHQFRIRRRLDQTRLLLVAVNHSVTDVCMQVGFSSLGSFSDLFANRVGTPPSSYQRRARVMVQVPGHFPHELFLDV